MPRAVALFELGLVRYADAISIQKRIARGVVERTSGNALILVEHPPVYTVGVRSAAYSEAEAVRLRSVGAEFERTDRGGLITFHGPGQLVKNWCAYPVLNLQVFRPSVRWYVRTLERTLVGTCRRLGVDGAATCSPHPGVWVDDDKIAAIGVHVKRFVTTHGASLNCNVDLAWYEHVVPCGIAGRGVTSLSKAAGRDVAVADAVPAFLDAFEQHFECVVCTQ